MGWTYCNDWTSTKAVQEELLRDLQSNYIILDKASTRYGRNFYVAVERKGTGERSIFVAMINGNPRGGYGYKDMSESMGPVIVDCPLRLFTAVPFDEAAYAPYVERCSSAASWEAQEAIRSEAKAAGLPEMFRAEWRHRVRAYHENAKRQYAKGDLVAVDGNTERPYAVYAKRSSQSYLVERDGSIYRCSRARLTLVKAS